MKNLKEVDKGAYDRDVIYSKICLYIMEYDDTTVQELYSKVMKCAKDYIDLRLQWNSLTAEEVA